ncbi:MAG TPA: ABC transporter ATP-binding protein [Acidimicrobiales bacterium]|nr:ABC transporter ATP-binding protein [Acidimicrobiales bacterium]
MVQISWRADAVRSVFTVMTAVGQMASLPLRAIGLKYLTDGFVRGDSQLALRGIAIIVGLTAVHRVMLHASLNVRMRLRENTQLYLDTHVMDLTAGIPGLEHHERPEYLDEVELIRSERGYLANPFNPISWTIASIVQGVSTVALLVGVHPVIALLPLFGIATAWASGRGESRLVALIDSQAEDNRVLRHLYELSTLPSSAKEVRIFGIAGELLRRRRSLFDRLETQRLGLARERIAISTGAWLLFAAAYVAALAFTARAAARGDATIGDAVLVLTIGSQLDQQLAELGENVAWFVRTHRAVRRLRWLTDYAERSTTALTPAAPAELPARLTDGIRVEGVSFAYPGTGSTVLERVDLHLPAGSTVAIVGENGAGKTTLVKLLCRFYEPSEGRIVVDGIDLRDVPVSTWRRHIAAGFQDFAMFQLLARETVGLGDVDSDLSRDEAMIGALTRAAAPEVVDQLPDRLATQLGREFDGGVELSLGQWQKLALGRAMMREKPLLLVLDEPTASLDAPTEHRLFDRFHTAARDAARERGAITILISHRFSTVRMADVILVVDGGRVREAGSHRELMSADGLYAELYRLQARSYD